MSPFPQQTTNILAQEGESSHQDLLQLTFAQGKQKRYIYASLLPLL